MISEIQTINGVTLYRGRVMIWMHGNGTHHWDNAYYKVKQTKGRMHVTIKGQNHYLDSLTRREDEPIYDVRINGYEVTKQEIGRASAFEI